MKDNFLEDIGNVDLLSAFNPDGESDKIELPKKEEKVDTPATGGDSNKNSASNTEPKSTEVPEDILSTFTGDVTDTTEAQPTNTTDSKTNSSNVYAFAKELVESEWLEAEEGELKEDMSPEDFINIFQKNAEKTAQRKLEDKISSFEGASKELLKAVIENGVDPIQFAISAKNAEITEEFDPTNSDDAEELVTEYLSRKDFTPEEIKDHIEILKDKGTLQTTAEKHKASLITMFNKQKEDAIAKAAEENRRKSQKLNDWKNEITNTVLQAVKEGDKDGIKFTDKDKSSVVEFITTPMHTLEDGTKVTGLYAKLIEAQKNPAQLVKLAKLLQNDLDVSKTIKLKKEEARKEETTVKKTTGLGFPKKSSFLD